MTEYSADYYEANGSDGDRIALRWYASLVNRYAPDGAVLDFGCGPGWMMRRMSMSRPCDGLEVSAYSRVEALRRNPRAFVHESVEQVADGFYSAVTAIHVLEHIPDVDVDGTLAGIVRVLRPGGALLLVTPDSTGRAAQVKGGGWRALTDPTHINLQGHMHWRTSVESAGLKVVSEGTDGLWDPPYTSWLADRARMVPIGMQVLAGRLMLPPGTGESSVIVAVKSELG